MTPAQIIAGPHMVERDGHSVKLTPLRFIPVGEVIGRDEMSETERELRRTAILLLLSAEQVQEVSGGTVPHSDMLIAQIAVEHAIKRSLEAETQP